MHMKSLASPARMLLLLLAAFASAGPVLAQGVDDVTDEYRVTLFPFHKINDKTTGFGYLGYVNNPDKGYITSYLGWGLSYSPNTNLQWWAGLVRMATDNESSSDKVELRPFVGLKTFLPNNMKWNIFNYARLEYRSVETLETNTRTSTTRVRDRFGAEFPLASGERAWQPGTWYGLADVEFFYKFDKEIIDPSRWRVGLAYIASKRVRAELIYHSQYTRPSGSSGLKHTENIWRLNVKLALNRGLLTRVFDGGDSDD